MSSRFWISLVVSLVGALAALAGMAWLVAVLVTPPPPRKYVSSTFEFDLPDGWSCQDEGTEVVCVTGSPPHAALAVLARKYRSGDDTLAGYVAELENRSTALYGSDPPEHARATRRSIGGHEWAEAALDHAEIEGYRTYYLATITSHVGVLVTFSVQLASLEGYRDHRDQIIESLVVHQRF